MHLQTFGFLQCPQNMGYRQWLQQWALYNTWKFNLTMKRFILDCLLLAEDLELWAMSSLTRSSNYLR